MTKYYTVKYYRITGGHIFPIKRNYCFFLPQNDMSRPLFIPQEHIVHLDDFLLPCNIFAQVIKLIAGINLLASTPHGDTSYYTALSTSLKQGTFFHFCGNHFIYRQI